MSIAGIGSAMGGTAQQKEGVGKIPSPEETFLAYMKKTPAERWVESWLAARGLTKEEFEALPPKEHEALAKEMAEDLKEAMQQKRV
ncbi:MAG TPA: hypothetical protein VG742_12900 [Dongiaceae bacterium]|nr:hypothetical protein [Dongiaceae bacterium]